MLISYAQFSTEVFILLLMRFSYIKDIRLLSLVYVGIFFHGACLIALLVLALVF